MLQLPWIQLMLALKTQSVVLCMTVVYFVCWVFSTLRAIFWPLACSSNLYKNHQGKNPISSGLLHGVDKRLKAKGLYVQLNKGLKAKGLYVQLNKGLKAKGLYVQLNKETDRTLTFTPLILNRKPSAVCYIAIIVAGCSKYPIHITRRECSFFI